MTVKEFRCRFLQHDCSSRATVRSATRMAVLPICLAVLISSFAIGCGGGATGPKRFPISGSVEREGIPMDDGNIKFAPTGGGPAISGQIVKGKYKFSKDDGAPAGKYNVVITYYPPRDMSGGGRKSDAPVVKDDRFKKPVPKDGWRKEVTITDDPKATYDFEVE